MRVETDGGDGARILAAFLDRSPCYCYAIKNDLSPGVSMRATYVGRVVIRRIPISISSAAYIPTIIVPQ